MSFEYQRSQRYFALVANELQPLATEELKSFGCTEVKPVYRGLHFTADKSSLYRSNYCTKFISKILAPLTFFQCHHTDALYKHARRIPWNDLLDIDTTFAIFATVSNSKISHSLYVTQILKDAIVDHFRDQCGQRPSVDTANPDIWLNVHIEKDVAIINFDTSGGPLHKRGYRRIQVEAPMMETLAAGIIGMTGWDGTTPLYDPMCGGGTLLAEAYLHYCRVPPGVLRQKFGLEALPDFDKTIWAKVKKEANDLRRPLPADLICGSDISGEVVTTAQTNCSALPGGNQIKIMTRDFRNIPTLEGHTIICNPPYGIRLEKETDLGEFYAAFGDFLKWHCRNSTAWIYVGVKELVKAIGLKPSRKIPLSNGALDGRLVKIEIY